MLVVHRGQELHAARACNSCGAEQRLIPEAARLMLHFRSHIHTPLASRSRRLFHFLGRRILTKGRSGVASSLARRFGNSNTTRQFFQGLSRPCGHVAFVWRPTFRTSLASVRCRCLLVRFRACLTALSAPGPALTSCTVMIGLQVESVRIAVFVEESKHNLLKLQPTIVSEAKTLVNGMKAPDSSPYQK